MTVPAAVTPRRAPGRDEVGADTCLRHLQRPRPLGLIGLLGLLGLLLATGCDSGRALQVRANYVSATAERIHDAAYNCAEREIAMAEAHLDFGTYEMERGNYLDARDHLNLAYNNVDAAAAIVDARPECWPDYIGDADGDGIPDDVDQCPYDPEDFDGFEDEDGCPDPDNDGDGICDPWVAALGQHALYPQCRGIDQCPNEPEDYDLFQDEDGCPDPDNDGDGILDVDDDCPNEPEDFDGFEDEDGCPEENYEYATLTDDRIEINQQINFAYDSARILPDSFRILDEVADILWRHPTIEIRIEGHTSSEGSSRHNQRLSEDRAASVRAYLIEAGINPGRMISIGYGEDRLLVRPERNEADRAANRRVEFHITTR
jgi:OmpA-OmpF porin, OOP family